MPELPNTPDDETSFRDLAQSLRHQPKRPAPPFKETAPGGNEPESDDGAGREPASGEASEEHAPQGAADAPAAPRPASGRGGPKKPFQRAALKPLPVISSSVSPRRLVEEWLAVMVQSSASDLILRAGGRPSLRVGGKIQFLPGRVPGPGPMLEIFRGVIGDRRLQEWTDTGSADAAIQLDGLGRFRINAYKQLGEPAMVIRRIGEHAPRLEDLHLPYQELCALALRKRGLILVTGIAGSGKSTTLAGMIEHMNERVERHVVTLEDPVELMFREKCCVISQREVGTDTTSFSDGLRHALRQSPDVILIGEVRDATTVVAALEATETGHLVMSTMHTVNAAQTVERMLGFFPGERHGQIRQRLADNLAGVLSQRLVPRKSGGLVPAYELMLSTPHIRELVEEGKTTEMARVIEQGGEAGLISYNECLRRLVEEQEVELSDALATSDRPEELLLALRGIRGSSDRVAGPSPADKGPGPGSANRRPPPREGGGEGLRIVGR